MRLTSSIATTTILETFTPKLTSMLPASQQPPHSKRKAADDGNPLLGTAKRTKKESKKSNKRKLINGEEQPGGLVIVRAPPSRPPSAQSNHAPLPHSQPLPEASTLTRAPSRPPSSQSQSQPQLHSSSQPPSHLPSSYPPTLTTSTHPASKKFRADSSLSRTLAERSIPSHVHHQHPAPSTRLEREDSLVLDAAVRGMEDETDTLRRRSRAAEDRAKANASGADLTSVLNTAFQFPPPSPASGGKRAGQGERQGKGSGKGQGGQRGRGRDSLRMLPEQETPQIERNKVMRGERESAVAPSALPAASAAMSADASTGRGAQSTHTRRKSSISRGKRISTSFEATGVITQPHTSVPDRSLYKHIDYDLPEPQRARQLLIWCTSRGQIPEPTSDGGSASTSTSTSTSRDANKSGKDPPLTKEGAEVLRQVKEDLIRMLAEKRIDTNVLSPGGEEGREREKAREREKVAVKETQNAKNRSREIAFNAHIDRAKQEDQEWSEVAQYYNAYRSKVLDDLEKRRASTPGLGSGKGKQRATDEDAWTPREYELPAEFRGRDGVELARNVLAETGAKNNKKTDSLMERMADLEYKIDRIHSFVNTAMQTTNVANMDLTYRFSLLSLALSARSLHSLDPSASSHPGSLSTYLPPTPLTTDPLELSRALTRVDAARPPAAMSDAARRAAREVQRATSEHAGGGGGLAERRLTGVPPPTPRKTPGTPRRGTTPGKERR